MSASGREDELGFGKLETRGLSCCPRGIGCSRRHTQVDESVDWRLRAVRDSGPRSEISKFSVSGSVGYCSLHTRTSDCLLRYKPITSVMASNSVLYTFTV